jgi:hypothetical protein
VALSAPLDIDALERLVTNVAAATGSPFQSYTLTIRPHVSTHGVVGGALLDAHMAPKLALTMDSTRIAPTNETTYRVTKAGAAQIATSSSRSVRFMKLALPVGVLRVLSLLGIVGGAAALAWNLLVLLGGGSGETDRIRARFSDRLVAVAGSHAGDYTDVVDVESIDELARVAERYDRMILDHGGDYRVADDGVLYRYRIAPAKS